MKHFCSVPSLLIASPQLQDETFKESVVLLIEHDDEGSLGFIINNKSQLTLDEVIHVEDEVIPSDICVWNAGPNGNDAGYILHHKNGTEKEIAPGFFLSSSKESLKNLIQEARIASLSNTVPGTINDDVLYPYRLLIGYSGWGPGQLEDEIQSGAWYTAPLDQSIIFNALCDNIWNEALESVNQAPDHQRLRSTESHWMH